MFYWFSVTVVGGVEFYWLLGYGSGRGLRVTVLHVPILFVDLLR